MIDYQKRVLSNGLTVVVEEDSSTTLVAVNILYKVGSRDESPNKTGFAHLFEHLMFGGSRNAPDFDTPLQNAGGENNAFTNTDYTNYYNVLPVDNIETALWLEADRMANLEINQRALDIQRKVVVEEFKEVCLNKPYGDNWHHLSALAYQQHPYNWPTIGKIPEHIQEAQIEDVRRFHEKYYHPTNAILSISGGLSVERSLELAEKWFQNIPTRKTEKKELKFEKRQIEQRHKKVFDDVPSAMFIGGCHMPNRIHKDYYACDLLSDILANGKSSRLYNRLVREQKILSSVDCYLTGTFDPGLIILEGRPNPAVSIAASIDALWTEISRLHNDPPNERELKKVKNKVIASIAMNDLSVLNKAASLAYFEWLGSLDLMNHQEDFYNKVTVDDILRVAHEYLRPENASIVEYVPIENRPKSNLS